MQGTVVAAERFDSNPIRLHVFQCQLPFWHRAVSPASLSALIMSQFVWVPFGTVWYRSGSVRVPFGALTVKRGIESIKLH